MEDKEQVVPFITRLGQEKSHQTGGAARANEKIGFQPWTSCDTHKRLHPVYTTTLLVPHACLGNFDYWTLTPLTQRDGAAARELTLPGKK